VREIRGVRLWTSVCPFSDGRQGESSKKSKSIPEHRDRRIDLDRQAGDILNFLDGGFQIVSGHADGNRLSREALRREIP
jgi:hypothetical protein